MSIEKQQKMKRNSSKSRYDSLSGLNELRYEKQLLQYKIEQQEKRIEKDWNTIYNRWNVISIVTNTFRSIIHYIPPCISTVSQIIKLFGKQVHK
jgi:hypothetical protein